MLNVRRDKHLANMLGVGVTELRHVAERAEYFCEELVLLDPAKPDKPRDVLNVRGDLRKIQDRLLRLVLMPKLRPSPFAHGSVVGRSIRSNVETHANSLHVFTADIPSFFPSIGRHRVYRLFTETLGCSPDVSRLCTKLCTHQHHLALGLITSPFIAEQIALPFDRRISSMCSEAGLIYSRFVDDIAVSANFDLRDSGFERVVRTIMGQHGFGLHKVVYGKLSEGTPVTKVVIRRGHPDVRRAYLEELETQIEGLILLANGHELSGPFFSRSTILGRVRFVCWINPKRKKSLLAKFNRIPWDRVWAEASRRGYVAVKKRLVPKETEVRHGLQPNIPGGSPHWEEVTMAAET
jgi:RNA-directed DNA polymerase